MGDLRALLATDIQDIVLSTDDLGEEGTYTPKGEAGRTIKFLPDRTKAPDDRAETRSSRVRSAVVRVANHATLGIVTPKEGDTLEMVLRAGGSAVTARLAEIISSTTASHRLRFTG
jgi:hypothetical protein